MARYDDDDTIRKPSGPQDMTAIDWVLCVLCPVIGCIVGIVRMAQGNPIGGKMIGISIGFIVLYNIISFAVQMAQR
jgi:hypothetical protein